MNPQNKTAIQLLTNRIRNLKKKKSFKPSDILKMHDYTVLLLNEVRSRPFYRNAMPLKKQKEMGII